MNFLMDDLNVSIIKKKIPVFWINWTKPRVPWVMTYHKSKRGWKNGTIIGKNITWFHGTDLTGCCHNIPKWCDSIRPVLSTSGPKSVQGGGPSPDFVDIKLGPTNPGKLEDPLIPCREGWGPPQATVPASLRPPQAAMARWPGGVI